MQTNRVSGPWKGVLWAILLCSGLESRAQAIQNPFNQVSGQANSFASSIQSEIDGILGEAESDIMNGIKDAIVNMVITTVSDALGVSSPLKSVEKLKEMMKDAYSKQQKIEYQQFKVDYQEKAAHTTLSSTFVNYYKELDLNTKAQALGKISTSVQNIINSRVFTAAERNAMNSAVGDLGNIDDLVDDVKTVCNQNGEAVWMSEAERVKVLDTARDEIGKRQMVMNQIRAQISNAFASRVRAAARNTTLSNLYNTDTQLNRTLSTTRKSY